MNISNFILFLLFTIIILCIYKSSYKYIHKEYILSHKDNKKYLVGKGKYNTESANLLAELNSKISFLIKNLKEENYNKTFYKNINLLISRFKPDNITENIFTSGSTAYTVNKGEEVSFCLKTKEKNIIYDINTLTFVAIHELAHIGCVSIGHTKEFVDFFVFLLKTSINLGIYKYIDYSKTPVDYCGVNINETPLKYSF
jgi:hypothetical protein